jgi:predicted HicB family RNase H-like nuclease
MTDNTPNEENSFYADPDNQTPQGPAVRRRPRNTAALPIRLPAELLEQVRERAASDDRSVSSWVRRAIEHELSRPA